MNEITLRVFSNQRTIDPVFLQNLESFVEQHGYHVAEERHFSAEDDLDSINLQEFLRETEAFSKRVGPIASDSADDIRELRDSR